MLKDLKQSTRQRLIALEFNYPNSELEAIIIVNETGVAAPIAQALTDDAEMIAAINELSASLF